jgi:hypothetical protein
MALENGTYVNSLVPANPASTDGLAQADDHIRLIKSTIKNTFPNITGPVTSTQAELDASLPAGHVSYLADLVNTGVTSTEYDYLDGVTSNIQTQIDSIVAGSSNIPQSNIDYLALITGAGVSSTQFGYLSSTTSDIQTQFTSLSGRVTTLESAPGATDTNNYVTGGSISGTTLTLSRQGLSDVSVTGLPAAVTTTSQLTNDSGFITSQYTQPTSVGAVGTYAWLGRSTAGIFTAGSSYSGSGLLYSGVLSRTVYNDDTAASIGTVSPSGTWRAMGTADRTTVRAASTLFLRIS